MRMIRRGHTIGDWPGLSGATLGSVAALMFAALSSAPAAGGSVAASAALSSTARSALALRAGSLTPITPASVRAANPNPIVIAVSSDRRSVYVGYETGTIISWYQRSASGR